MSENLRGILAMCLSMLGFCIGDTQFSTYACTGARRRFAFFAIALAGVPLMFALLTTTVAMIAAVAASIAMAPTSQAAPAPAAPAPAPAAPAPAAKQLSGKTVFLDPGHQGSAAGHDLNKPVPDGRGGTKPCQTSGATGVNGVPEHTVNWQVAQLVKGALESQGARVVLSRPNDTGWGGCIDERAAAANRSA